MKKTIFALILTTAFLNCFRPEVSKDPTADTPVTGELKIEDLKVGTGLTLEKDAKMVVHYKGSLTDGTEFANSYKSGKPLVILFGNGELIKGWEEGMKGMRIGGVRKLTIPPHLGYGNRGLRNIPPNSTLIFEVKLVDILH